MGDMASTLRKRLTHSSIHDRRYERPMTWEEADLLLLEIDRLREALEGVIRIADRDCPEFRAARAALAEKEAPDGRS